MPCVIAVFFEITFAQTERRCVVFSAACAPRCPGCARRSMILLLFSMVFGLPPCPYSADMLAQFLIQLITCAIVARSDHLRSDLRPVRFWPKAEHGRVRCKCPLS